MSLARSMRLLLPAAGMLFAVSPIFAQARIGVINLQQALLDTAEIKKAQADLEAKYKPRQEAMQKLQNELQEIQRQLTTMQGKLTAEAERELQIQGQRKQRDLQRMTEDLQGDVDRERNEILSRSGQRMQAVVQKLAESKTLDLVVDVSDTVYFKPALDVTKEATAAYDQAHPVK